ncbi:YciI family protein [Undibacterium sp.]|uniref:YciI family protein n=1 Tax=Undibacterium sp. TaxID=1914977 RepID=UPI002BDC32D4|nr:YciI family protein [Undibacterium sp.]HTD06582.1 YciI family protein [Undibacterium sp.]
MRFMIIRKADKSAEAGELPDEKLIAAMGRYNEELMKAGIMLAGEGLQPSAKGARIKFSGGKPRIVDGPFTEAKELIAGFTMIDVRSREEALEWVKRWPPLDGGGEVELELRQVYEAADFGAGLTPELRQAEERMREHLLASGRQLGSKP